MLTQHRKLGVRKKWLWFCTEVAKNGVVGVFSHPRKALL
jgi:hypothetical protein